MIRVIQILGLEYFCTFRKVEHWSLLKFIGFIPSYANLVVYEYIINGYYDLCLFL